jgi:long-subunit fatty acid transport protein
MAARVGVELRDEDHWRVEIAWVWENWSVHDVLELDVEEAVISNVVGIGDYRLTKVEIPRNLSDTWSLRVGAEGKLPTEVPMMLRGGFAYEPSALKDEYLTAMSVDTDKVIMAFGGGVELWEVTFDFTYSFIFMPTRTVLKSDVLQTTAARPAWEGRTSIGEGIYESRAHLLGLGASWAF